MKNTTLSLFLCSLMATAALAGCGGDDSAVSSSGAAAGGGGSGTGGGGTGGGTGGTGGSFQVGDPISAPDEQWTWVAFPDALCANGSPTGLAINRTTKSKKLIIYLQGGGACWDDLTCNTLMTAVNLNGYDESNYQSDVQGLLSGAVLFSRTDGENPFRDYSYVVIPYCTGDVHAGNNTAMYATRPIMHVGRKNVEAFLRRIVPTFPDAEYVVISGSSAGGFGAGLNWELAQNAFGSVRVDLLDDSGPPLPAPYLKDSLSQQWRASWNLDEALPPGCTECKTKLDALLSYYATKYSDHRAGLMSYLQDGVIAQYFQISGPEVQAGLEALAQGTFQPAASFKYYYVTGSSHTVFGNPKGITQSGVRVIDWITQMVTDDPAWDYVQP